MKRTNWGFELETIFWGLVVTIVIFEVGCRMLLGFSFIAEMLRLLTG